MSKNGPITRHVKYYQRSLCGRTPPTMEATVALVERLKRNLKLDEYGKILGTAINQQQWNVAADLIEAWSVDGLEYNLRCERNDISGEQVRKMVAPFASAQNIATLAMFQQKDIPEGRKVKCVQACLMWDSDPVTGMEKKVERTQNQIIVLSGGLAKFIPDPEKRIDFCNALMKIATADESKLAALKETKEVVRDMTQGGWGDDLHRITLGLGIYAAVKASAGWCKYGDVDLAVGRQYMTAEEEIVAVLQKCWGNGWGGAQPEVKKKMQKFAINVERTTSFQRATDGALDTFILACLKETGSDTSTHEPYYPREIIQQRRARIQSTALNPA